MKSKLIISSVVVLFALGSYAPAHAGKAHCNHCQAASAQQKTGASSENAIEVGNTICPVSGEEIGKMGESTRYEYNGKIYNLCCAMCVEDFQKDPERYSNKSEESIGIQNNKHQGCGCSGDQSCKG